MRLYRPFRSQAMIATGLRRVSYRLAGIVARTVAPPALPGNRRQTGLGAWGGGPGIFQVGVGRKKRPGRGPGRLGWESCAGRNRTYDLQVMSLAS